MSPAGQVPSASPEPAALDAVILAGGRAARLGGADKPALPVGASTMVASVVAAAVGAGAFRVVVVGPRRPELAKVTPGPPGGICSVREDPPAAGPLPALRCGLACVRARAVLLLAADLPFLRGRHLAGLVAAAGQGAAAGLGGGAARERQPAARSAGAVMLDDSGRAQWLVGCWQTARLRAAAGCYRGSSLHGLLAPLLPVPVRWALAPGEPPPWLDCDTAEDLRAAIARLRSPAAAEREPG